MQLCLIGRSKGLCFEVSVTSEAGFTILSNKLLKQLNGFGVDFLVGQPVLRLVKHKEYGWSRSISRCFV
jgi:hypothetical protein